jgi:thiosulfate/3-mercaptopyruvate sulfurtransferase
MTGLLPPLADPAAVAAMLGRPGLVLLDVSSDPQAYDRGHIPGAVYTDYGRDGWRVTRNGIVGLLPEPAYMEELIGELGIGNGDHVVIVAQGRDAYETAAAARVYWTFRVLGHAAVSILNGGMKAWRADRDRPIEHGMPGDHIAKNFAARFDETFFASEADVRGALARGLPLIDVRPHDQFLGINKTVDVARHGALPGAIHLPGSWLTLDNGGRFRDLAALGKLYGFAGVPMQGPAIVYCNTGHWSSLGWFVSVELLGNRAVKMYDGSMAEWSRDPDNPMVTAIDLD